jgi:ELWxxDGT repeat protein
MEMILSLADQRRKKSRTSVFLIKALPITLLALALGACGGGGSDGGGGGGGNGGGGGDGGGNGSVAAFSEPVYFIGNDGSSGNTSDGSQLWKTNGTEPGTEKVKAIAPGDDAEIEQITPVGDKVFFVANDNDGHGQQVWVSDGTEAGTERLTDSTELDPGTATTLSELNGQLYFRGLAPSGEIWIWQSDGTAAGTGPADSPVTLTNGLSLLTPFKDHLYFRANDGTNGAELWRSDGTEANTDLVANIQTDGGFGSLSTCPDNTDGLVELDGMLYFSANDGADGGCDLWRTNGELGNAEKVKEVSNSFNTGPIDLVAADNKLFFLTRSEGETDGAVWVSDGTEAGTIKVFDEDDDVYRVMMGSSGPTGIGQPILAAGDHAYFYVNDRSKASTEALQLWQADSTGSGLLVDLERNVLGGEIDMAVATGQLFFVHLRPDIGSDIITNNRGLWTAKGEDVELLHSGFTGSNGGKPLLQADGGNALLFSSMGEVWRTGGTTASTAFVSDICPGPCFGFKSE